jgi:hypothetical protein
MDNLLSFYVSDNPQKTILYIVFKGKRIIKTQPPQGD